MSALGQKRTWQRILLTSALPPKADIGTQPCDVRFVPKAEVDASLNNFVCAREQRGRNCEAERLSSLEIDYQLVLHRSLYWKVGRLLALENAIDVARRAPKQVLRINAI